MVHVVNRMERVFVADGDASGATAGEEFTVERTATYYIFAHAKTGSSGNVRLQHRRPNVPDDALSAGETSSAEVVGGEFVGVDDSVNYGAAADATAETEVELSKNRTYRLRATSASQAQGANLWVLAKDPQYPGQVGGHV